MYYCTLYDQLTYVITSDEGATPYSFVFPKSSELVHYFDVTIRLMEPKIDEIMRKYIHPQKSGTKNLVRTLTVFEMIGVFYLLTAGLLASLIAFLLELTQRIKY